MDSIDRDILKFMSHRNNYYEMKDIITKSLCVKESWQLLTDFGEYFKQYPNKDEIDGDFKMWQRVQRHPNWKPEQATTASLVVDNVLSTPEPERDVFMDQLEHLRSVSLYEGLVSELSAGRLTSEQAEARVRKHSTNKSSTDSIFQTDLTNLAHINTSGGYYWRLEDLNRSLGPLRKGDFIVVAKRPEVGGTSFLVSELSYMLEQTKGNCVIFNNEEEPSKVYTRMVSAATGVDYRTLLGDPSKHQALYNKWLNGKSFDLIHDTQMTMGSIERTLENKDYDLIGINVLLKVGGTESKEDHDKFQELGTFCRHLAERYGPVIAIVQADPQAEGVAFIPQDKIYKSKTALQGEADGLIFIGTDEIIQDDVRYIHVAKNKLPPAPCCDIKAKHIKTEVKFDMDTGRFTSKNFATHSRS